MAKKKLTVKPFGDTPGEKVITAQVIDLLKKLHGATAPRVVMAWLLKVNEDADGHTKAGQCKKYGDLERQISGYDFAILLNWELWHAKGMTDEIRAAVLHHECVHTAPAVDKETGEQKRDELNRPLWRIRKHDVQEFVEVAEEHGAYERELQRLAQALKESKAQPLLAETGA